VIENSSVQRTFFLALLLVVTAAFLFLIRGFLQPIFWAIALAIVVFPVHVWILRKLRGREALAAITSVVLVVVVVILPLLIVAGAVAREAGGLYERLDTGSGGIGGIIQQAEDSMPRIAALLERVGIDPERLRQQLSAAAVTASQFVAQRAVSIGQNTVRFAVFFFLMLYLLFFFLRDGQRMIERLVRALPLGDERERLLMNRFAQVSRATIKGTFVVGIVQGAIGGIAFAVLGLGAPVLWGSLMALLSMLPAVGTALVWLPAAIILIVGDRIGGGVALILVGVLGIGLVDNFLRPLLVGRDTSMPDYLILLATLGGLAGFGLAGIVIGPIIAAFFLAVWEMAHTEFEPSP
jgi:predicted PurR-regulated permease PerM